VEDRERILLKSGKLSSRQDIEIDGLFFRLASVEKNGSLLTLTFEDREVALLRTYDKPIKQSLATSRQKITRAQFVLRLIREVREVKIPYVVPELNAKQKVAGTPATQVRSKAADRPLGIMKVNDLTVKSQKMSEEQRNNANGILDKGVEMLVPRRNMVMAIMCCIQESTLRNLTGGDRDSVGLFQQRASQGWPATRDIPVDAEAFYVHLGAYLSTHPNAQYWEAIQAVQISGFPHAYAQWRTEAERIVTAYGFADGTIADNNSQYHIASDTGDYEFYRGRPPTRKQSSWGKESSWDCIKRLAQETNWRAFFVSGVFYFVSEAYLLRSQPIATIDEDTRGIVSIDGTYAEGTKSASLRVACEMKRWAAPPGSVVQIRNMGPWNGRWLVNDVDRSAFSHAGVITLKKKAPRLPEPSGGNVANATAQTQTTWTGDPPPGADRGHQFRTPGAFVQPVPAGHGNRIVQNIHATSGLAGYPAVDFGGDAEAPVVAVESGKITKLSGHDPATGPSSALLGVHGPFGWSVYITGDSGAVYYYTHLGSRLVSIGETVAAGETIASIGDYAKWGGVNHVHLGVNPSGTQNGHPDITDILNSPIATA
jgi:murein DD-endopeptidase MepM/ murein hydrolase activator NlpD